MTGYIGRVRHCAVIAYKSNILIPGSQNHRMHSIFDFEMLFTLTMTNEQKSTSLLLPPPPSSDTNNETCKVPHGRFAFVVAVADWSSEMWNFAQHTIIEEQSISVAVYASARFEGHRALHNTLPPYAHQSIESVERSLSLRMKFEISVHKFTVCPKIRTHPTTRSDNNYIAMYACLYIYVGICVGCCCVEYLETQNRTDRTHASIT